MCRGGEQAGRGRQQRAVERSTAVLPHIELLLLAMLLLRAGSGLQLPPHSCVQDEGNCRFLICVAPQPAHLCFIMCCFTTTVSGAGVKSSMGAKATCETARVSVLALPTPSVYV